MKYRFHVVGLPHTQTTAEYNCCAYTQKVIKFCKMMMDLGHIVYLYGSVDNEAECTEFIPCYPKRWHPRNYLDVPFDPRAEHWQTMNRLAIEGIKQLRQPHDFLCLIAGRCQEPIAAAIPDMMAVEFGVGYAGVFAKYRVFESCAWMHTVYGQLAGSADKADGNFYDRVIPNFFDPADFPFIKDDPFDICPEPYYLYLGRLTDRKGWRIAQEVCEKMGHRLIVAGPGEFSGYGEYAGVLDAKKRAYYLGHATAVFCPTLYIEPFCGVMAEAMLCGTPVISTPWGTFAENNQHGKTGFRCTTFNEFCEATTAVKRLNYKKIADYAVHRWSMENVRMRYQAYFDKLYTLWGKGWYA